MITAGIIIIGDEILNGRVADTNSPYLCQRFYAIGIQVKRISVIPDDLEMIASDVKSFSNLFDIVVTTGGVGPTHDDVTYEAIAIAFHTTLRVDNIMKDFFQWYMENQDPSAEKLVRIPSIAEVLILEIEEPLEGGLNKYPVVRTKNVYNFPGVPSITRKLFTAMEEKYFQNSRHLFFSREVFLNVYEIKILSVLNAIVVEFEDRARFGSYPLMDNSQGEKELTKIYVESSNLADCLDAEVELLQRLPPQWYVPVRKREPNFDLIGKLMTSTCELASTLRLSFEIIDKCFAEYDISEMFFCFNGGKDCTVLLNLVYYYCKKNKIHHPLKLLYFRHPDSFPEVDLFIEEVKSTYQVDLSTFPVPMKSSLIEFLKTEKKRKASFLGQRNSDPRSKNLKPVQETDSDWPKLIRIFPILHWSYKDIWDFIRCVNIPYCSLYDRGFTSLGTKKDTGINPALKITNGEKIEYYRPAFLLSEEEYERKGRFEFSGDAGIEVY